MLFLIAGENFIRIAIKLICVAKDFMFKTLNGFFSKLQFSYDVYKKFDILKSTGDITMK